MSAQNPTCPTDCSTNLPEVEFSDCSPEINSGQILKLYVTNDGNPLSDWTSGAAWALRIDNTAPAATSILELTVIGEKPVPEATEKEISGGRTVKGKKNHVLNIDVDETNTTNYEFLRGLECGGSYRIWYTDSKYLYGGNDGIKASIFLDHVIPKDDAETQTFTGTVKWSDSFHPERILNPIA